MIGRGERYPLVRHVTEDEICPRRRTVSVSATCRAIGTRLARPTIRSTRNPGWCGIRGAHAAYPGLRCSTPTAYSSRHLLLASTVNLFVTNRMQSCPTCQSKAYVTTSFLRRWGHAGNG